MYWLQARIVMMLSYRLLKKRAEKIAKMFDGSGGYTPMHLFVVMDLLSMDINKAIVSFS